MSSYIPVFQMVFASTHNNEIGLAFSSEEGEEGLFCLQQPLYVVPVVPGIAYEKYYLPGEVDGKRVNFDLNLRTGENILVLEDYRLKYPVRFRLNYYFEYWFRDQFPYIGKRTDFIQPYSTFCLLEPLDLLIMDQLYRETQACFVGLNPVYNSQNNPDNERGLNFR